MKSINPKIIRQLPSMSSCEVGIENPLFWFVVVIVGSMIPFVGTLVGILPVFIITLASGHNFEA